MFESLMAINGLLVAVFFAVGILMLILRIWNVGKTEYVKRPFISGIVFIFPIIPMYNQRYGISLVLLIAAVLVNINLYFSSDTSGIWLLLGKSVLACAIILVPFLFIYWKIFIVGFYLIIPAVLTVMAIFIEQIEGGNFENSNSIWYVFHTYISCNNKLYLHWSIFMSNQYITGNTIYACDI